MKFENMALMFVVAAALSGCVNVNLPLGGPQELQEVTVEDSEGLFARNKILLVDVGGVIYIANIGAYSCASALTFNGIPPAKVIVV